MGQIVLEQYTQVRTLTNESTRAVRQTVACWNHCVRSLSLLPSNNFVKYRINYEHLRKKERNYVKAGNFNNRANSFACSLLWFVLVSARECSLRAHKHSCLLATPPIFSAELPVQPSGTEKGTGALLGPPWLHDSPAYALNCKRSFAGAQNIKFFTSNNPAREGEPTTKASEVKMTTTGGC
jgi:hypothetical protein